MSYPSGAHAHIAVLERKNRQRRAKWQASRDPRLAAREAGFNTHFRGANENKTAENVHRKKPSLKDKEEEVGSAGFKAFVLS